MNPGRSRGRDRVGHGGEGEQNADIGGDDRFRNVLLHAMTQRWRGRTWCESGFEEDNAGTARGGDSGSESSYDVRPGDGHETVSGERLGWMEASVFLPCIFTTGEPVIVGCFSICID